MKASPELIGIDGCRGGWLVAESDAALSALSFTIVDDLEPVIARAERNGALLAIDIPSGSRTGDRAAAISRRGAFSDGRGDRACSPRPADPPSLGRPTAARAD